SGSSPVEIFRAASAGGVETALTHLNDAVLASYQLTPLEEFWVTGAENTPVQWFVVKPPAFNPNRKYAALMLIHGRPQGAWGERGVSGRRVRRAGLVVWAGGRRKPRSCGFPAGNSAAWLGTTPTCMRAGRPAFSSRSSSRPRSSSTVNLIFECRIHRACSCT